MHNFLKSLLKTAEEGTLLNSFNETTIPKYQNKTKISHTKKKERERERKLQANITDKHRCENPQQNASK